MNYVKLLKKDTGLETAAEIKTAMMDRDDWRARTRRTSVLRPGEVSQERASQGPREGCYQL